MTESETFDELARTVVLMGERMAELRRRIESLERHSRAQEADIANAKATADGARLEANKVLFQLAAWIEVFKKQNERTVNHDVDNSGRGVF